MDIQSTKWGSDFESESKAPGSPFALNNRGSTISVWSGDSDDWISLEQYPSLSFPGMPKCVSKPALRYREFVNVKLPSLFGKEDPLKVASIEMDKIYYDLATYEKQFEYPSDLRFSINMDSCLILADVGKYKPVLEQLQKLDGLRTRLARVQSYGNVHLRDKRAYIRATIESHLRTIKEHQLKLYQQAVEAALDELHLDLNASVQKFEYPSKLNCPPRSRSGLILDDTEEIQLFVNQLHKLDAFLEKLDRILAYGGVQLQDKRELIVTTIERALQRMNPPAQPL